MGTSRTGVSITERISVQAPAADSFPLVFSTETRDWAAPACWAPGDS